MGTTTLVLSLKHWCINSLSTFRYVIEKKGLRINKNWQITERRTSKVSIQSTYPTCKRMKVSWIPKVKKKKALLKLKMLRGKKGINEWSAGSPSLAGVFVFTLPPSRDHSLFLSLFSLGVPQSHSLTLTLPLQELVFANLHSTRALCAVAQIQIQISPTTHPIDDFYNHTPS